MCASSRGEGKKGCNRAAIALSINESQWKASSNCHPDSLGRVSSGNVMHGQFDGVTAPAVFFGVGPETVEVLAQFGVQFQERAHYPNRLMRVRYADRSGRFLRTPGPGPAVCSVASRWRAVMLQFLPAFAPEPTTPRGRESEGSGPTATAPCSASPDAERRENLPGAAASVPRHS